MRIRSQLQLYLKPASAEIAVSQELREISVILEKAHGIAQVYESALRNLHCGKEVESRQGRDGMTAEQVLRAGIVRYRFGYSYRKLADASKDSLSIREFFKLGFGKGFKKSALQENIKKISEQTWQMLNDCLKRYALEEGLETGEKLRTDTTTSKTNIHYPSDASLLNDSIRVLTRAMTRGKELGEAPIQFTNHYRASKKKLYQINNSRKKTLTRRKYLELIRLAKTTVSYAETALEVIKAFNGTSSFDALLALEKVHADLERHIPLAKQVIDQAHRRIVKGEKVPSSEKIVSIFEPHSNILVKGTRDVVFGHKVCVTTGASALILDVSVLDGNPNDSTLVKDVIENHEAFFGHAPTHAAFDGCFGSEENRSFAKSRGVQELTFSKNRSLDLASLVSSKLIHKKLRNFRAGIEATISLLKRVFQWSRVLDKGRESVAAAIHAGAVACNLFLLARLRLT